MSKQLKWWWQLPLSSKVERKKNEEKQIWKSLFTFIYHLSNVALNGLFHATISLIWFMGSTFFNSMLIYINLLNCFWLRFPISLFSLLFLGIQFIPFLFPFGGTVEIEIIYTSHHMSIIKHYRRELKFFAKSVIKVSGILDLLLILYF